MSLFESLFGGFRRVVRKANKPKKPFHLPRKPSKAEAMKAWGAKVQPGKGGYVPKGKR